MDDICDRLTELMQQEVYNTPTVRDAKAEIARLRAYKSDVEEAARVAAEEDCGGERHCTCVPLLRWQCKEQQAEIERRRAENERLRKLVVDELSGGTGGDVQ